MSTVKSAEIHENDAVIGYDVSHQGVSHRLMLGETYEGKPINSRHDAEQWIVALVDAENERRNARTTL